jgi:hypothetical protein
MEKELDSRVKLQIANGRKRPYLSPHSNPVHRFIAVNILLSSRQFALQDFPHQRWVGLAFAKFHHLAL